MNESMKTVKIHNKNATFCFGANRGNMPTSAKIAVNLGYCSTVPLLQFIVNFDLTFIDNS